jgi:hypothetical protein
VKAKGSCYEELEQAFDHFPKYHENSIRRLDLTGTRLQESGENFIMRGLMICTPHPLFCG